MKATIYTLGCKVNQYETQALKEMLILNNYEIVSYKEKADIYIVNTCCVTKESERKSRQVIRKAKRINPDACVICIGCYPQIAHDKTDFFDEVDIVMGTTKKNELINNINKYFNNKSKILMIDDVSKLKTYEEIKCNQSGERTRGIIKIQDGCDSFCSYCIIPYTRGRSRSRKIEDVVSETKELVKSGYLEVILTGIHLASYGKEFNSSLIEIIEKVAEVEGVKKIRLGSLDPSYISEEFALNASKITKLCPHFHLSLQSGSDTVLKRMNRKYDSAKYRDAVSHLREYFTNPAITTDIIVGFPGETEKEFEETLLFAKEIDFAKIHVFRYSRRPGTKADSMINQINEEIKEKRSHILIAQANESTSRYINSFKNKELEIMIEKKSKLMNGYFEGTSVNYFTVLCKSSENIKGKIVKLYIEKCYNTYAIGRIIE